MSKQNPIEVTLKSFNDFGKYIKVSFDYQLLINKFKLVQTTA